MEARVKWKQIEYTKKIMIIPVGSVQGPEITYSSVIRTMEVDWAW